MVRIAGWLSLVLMLVLMPALYSVPAGAQPGSHSQISNAWGTTINRSPAKAGSTWGSNTWGAQQQGSVVAQGGGTDYERRLGKMYDYILTCDAEAVDNYLNYKGSTLSGMVKFTITYYPTPGSVRRGQQVPPPILYEELWYHDGKCVGQKRYNEIYPRQMAQGAIYFRGITDNVICDHSMETGNCAIRLLMEIYVKRSILAGVIIPAQCFEAVASNLGYFNFFLLEEASGGKGENMSLHLISYPRIADRYFYYDDTGRR